MHGENSIPLGGKMPCGASSRLAGTGRCSIRECLGKIRQIPIVLNRPRNIRHREHVSTAGLPQMHVSLTTVDGPSPEDGSAGVGVAVIGCGCSTADVYGR